MLENVNNTCRNKWIEHNTLAWWTFLYVICAKHKTWMHASRLVEMIKSAFRSRGPEFLIKFFVTYIRPLLECASIIWLPPSVAWCNLLENVQCRFTWHLRGMAELDYEQRLSITLTMAVNLQLFYRSLRSIVFAGRHGWVNPLLLTALRIAPCSLCMAADSDSQRSCWHTVAQLSIIRSCQH